MGLGPIWGAPDPTTLHPHFLSPLFYPSKPDLAYCYSSIESTCSNLNVDTGIADYCLKFTLADCCFMSRKDNLDDVTPSDFSRLVSYGQKSSYSVVFHGNSIGAEDYIIQLNLRSSTQYPLSSRLLSYSKFSYIAGLIDPLC